MRGYSDIERSTSSCVHFVEASDIDQELIELKREIDSMQIRCAYIDCRTLLRNPEVVCDEVARAVRAEHAPYGEENWVRLLDDMISLSSSLRGLVIVMDHADELLAANKRKIFDLIEAFLIQFHHWLNKGKPCHLCFQMSPHPLVRQVLGDQGLGPLTFLNRIPPQAG
jgi:hypothetical protein